jgi:SPW repeat
VRLGARHLAHAVAWVLLFEYDTMATRNAVIVGFLIVSAEAVTLSYFCVWEEWINVALGTWLVVSPWVLGVASVATQANFAPVGLLVAGLALYQVWEVGRRPDGQAKA